jgi:sulfite exporter TauE/SafE/copper chaperone CopZ
MTDVILRISGMDCGACAVRIVCALRGLPGVHAVFVSDTAGCARLTYDEAAVGLGEIARCVQRAGDTFMVTLWPVGTDAAALPAVLGPGAELTAQRGGEEAQQGRTRQRLARRLGFGVLLTALMLWRLPELVQLALAAAVLFGAGAALWRGTWRVLRGGSLGPDAPGLLAALILFAYSAYAAFTGLRPCFPAPCGIVCALLAGKYAAQLVRGALHAPVRRLRHLRPRTATVVRDGVGTPVDADALTPRDVVRVLPGERIPVDGIVRSGTCTVDESALTGASRPVEKAVEDTVLAGTLNRAGSASITPTAIGDATVLQRTIAALQRAQTVRTPEQVRLERAASRLTALLVLLAIGVGVVWLFWRQPGDLARADALLHTRGVVSAQAHYWRGRVTITYDPNIVTEDTLRQVLTNAGYPPGTHGMGGVVVDGICLALVGVLYWGLPKLLALVKVPALANNASLGLVFLVGLLTSTHCIGMCGGILLAQTTDARGVTGRSKRGLIASAAYNGGRVVSYTAVGALCGALGAVITYTPNIKSMAFTVAGALVLLIGLRMAGILPGLRSTETELPGACSLNARTRRRFAGRPLIIGLLTGVMPCGALSAMWLCAMSSGSAARGALVMLVFSLGTVPLLFLFGALQSFLPRGWMKYIVKGSAVLVVTLGLSMLVKGIRLFGM